MPPAPVKAVVIAMTSWKPLNDSLAGRATRQWAGAVPGLECPAIPDTLSKRSSLLPLAKKKLSAWSQVPEAEVAGTLLTNSRLGVESMRTRYAPPSTSEFARQ